MKAFRLIALVFASLIASNSVGLADAPFPTCAPCPDEPPPPPPDEPPDTCMPCEPPGGGQ